jgi:hypothetical protein
MSYLSSIITAVPTQTSSLTLRKSTNRINRKRKGERSEACEDLGLENQQELSQNVLFIPFKITDIEIRWRKLNLFLFSNYCYFLLYQKECCPAPFSQLEKDITNRAMNDSSSSSAQLRKDEKLIEFVERFKFVFHHLELFFEKMENCSSTVPLHVDYMGIGFGPSMSNFKKVFILRFPSSHSTDNDRPISIGNSSFSSLNLTNRFEKYRRSFLQKLIEYDSTSNESINKHIKLKNNNIFLFFHLKYPQEKLPAELLTNSSILSEFSYSHSFSIPYDLLVQTSSKDNGGNSNIVRGLDERRKKQLQKKLFQINIEYNSSSSSEADNDTMQSECYENDSRQHGILLDTNSAKEIYSPQHWFVLRKGIKPLR